MSSFESKCSVKKRRRRRRNRRSSGQLAIKTKAKEAAIRTTNTTVITTQKNQQQQHNYYVSPIYATSMWRKPAGSFTCVYSDWALPALSTSILHSRAAIINDLIIQTEVQMLWLLCPRFNQSRNDHSTEKVVVSSGQNTPVVLRDRKLNSKIEFNVERLLNVPPYFTTNNSAVCLQLVFVCFVRSSEYTTFIFLPSVNRFVWNYPHCAFYATELN